MGTATALFDAVDALRKSIVAAAATAKPEELAYLGTALEKIAGHVTLLELSEHVDTLKTVLDTYKTSLEGNFATTLATQTQNAQSEMARTKETYLHELSVQQMNSQAAITATSNATTQTVNDAAAVVINQVNGILAQLTSAMDDARTTAEAVRDEKPFNEADLMFYAAV